MAILVAGAYQEPRVVAGGGGGSVHSETTQARAPVPRDTTPRPRVTPQITPGACRQYSDSPRHDASRRVFYRRPTMERSAHGIVPSFSIATGASPWRFVPTPLERKEGTIMTRHTRILLAFLVPMVALIV